MASSFLRFLDHTQRSTTVGATPLDEWPVRRRDLYLTAHNSLNRQTPMTPPGFKHTVLAGERPQTARPLGTTQRRVIAIEEYRSCLLTESFEIYKFRQQNAKILCNVQANGTYSYLTLCVQNIFFTRRRGLSLFSILILLRNRIVYPSNIF
jgi:hypothetical protein